MKKTRHRVRAATGKSVEATVEHHYEKAVEYVFYLPAALCSLPEVQRFIETLAALEGATISEGETGIWKGQKEKTNIVRLLVRLGNLTPADMEATLRREIGGLMAALSMSKEHAQEAMTYTESAVKVVTARNVRRVGG